jgi:hypothetical protein
MPCAEAKEPLEDTWVAFTELIYGKKKQFFFKYREKNIKNYD